MDSEVFQAVCQPALTVAEIADGRHQIWVPCTPAILGTHWGNIGVV